MQTLFQQLPSEQLYTATGKDFIPYDENKPLQQLVKAIQQQTKGECKNITQSMGFAVKQPDGKLAFKPIAQYYQDTLDKAVVDITSGTFDYNTVLNRTVSEMTNSGLRTVDYASGWSNRVNVAARRAVMTGVRQVTAKISEDNAEKLETEYFEVSWHRGARPSHQEFQGKVHSKEELVSVCGLGTVEGLCGANCYHSYDPFVMGVSERKYTDEWLAEQNTKENTPVEYNGKEYTLYEATQRQRRLETTMRAQREKIKLLEEGNADEDSIIAAKARYFKTSDEYVRFSKAMDLPQQRERVFIDGNGVTSDKSIANSRKSDIIKSLDVDDYEVVTYGKNIADDVNNTIIETMKQCENNGNFIISEISAKSIPATADGTPVLQIEPLSNGLLQLNLNTDVLSGRSLAEIDKMFETTDDIAANSLAEAIIHESGHAISISGKTVSDIEKLYEELSALEVLRSRGAKVSDEAMRFYEKYMRRKY